MRGKEISSRDILASELRADLRLSQTRPNSAPIVVAGDVIPEPGGEAVEAVLAEGHAGGSVGAAVARDDECEDEEDEEEDDEHEHADEVEAEEALLLPVGADEAGEGDEEECDAEEDEGPPEPTDALVVGLGGQPYAGGDDGDGAHQRDEVQQRRYVVAHCHDCCCLCERRWRRERERERLISEEIVLKLSQTLSRNLRRNFEYFSTVQSDVAGEYQRVDL